MPFKPKKKFCGIGEKVVKELKGYEKERYTMEAENGIHLSFDFKRAGEAYLINDLEICCLRESGKIVGRTERLLRSQYINFDKEEASWEGLHPEKIDNHYAVLSGNYQDELVKAELSEVTNKIRIRSSEDPLTFSRKALKGFLNELEQVALI